MTADQFNWFNQQNFSPSLLKSISRSWTSSTGNLDDNVTINFVNAIENNLSNRNVKAEILASYNDSIITAIQTNLTFHLLNIFGYLRTLLII
ncbi:hypothetical protein I4U23_006005 [Adineta vaga]|nr:hypothetical protein I4U23_006005 [Adineta vaga]